MKQNGLGALIALALSAALGISVAVSVPAIAGDDGEEASKVKKVRITKHMDCEDEECGNVEHHHAMIRKMIGDMDVDIECDGEDCDDHVHVFISEDGKVHKHGFSEGEPIEWVEDCEGEDCRKKVEVIVKKAGGNDEIHALVSQAIDKACQGDDCTKQVIVIDGDGTGMSFWEVSGSVCVLSAVAIFVIVVPRSSASSM